MKDYRTVKTSIVVVAVNGRREIYPSIDDLPPALRDKLVESTSGGESGKILIADHNGRDVLLKSLRERTGSRRRSAMRPEPQRNRLPGWVRGWGAVVVPGLLGLTIWLLFTYR